MLTSYYAKSDVKRAMSDSAKQRKVAAKESVERKQALLAKFKATLDKRGKK